LRSRCGRRWHPPIPLEIKKIPVKHCGNRGLSPDTPGSRKTGARRWIC
jgi:hypothetical protein